MLDNNICTNLGIILRIPGVQRNGLQVEPAVKIHGGDDVLEGGYDAFDSSDMLLLQGKRSRSGRYGCRSRG